MVGNCRDGSAEGVHSSAARSSSEAFEGCPEVVCGVGNFRGSLVKILGDGGSQMSALDGVKLCQDNFLPNGSILVPSPGGCRFLPQGGKGACLGGMSVKDRKKG